MKTTIIVLNPCHKDCFSIRCISFYFYIPEREDERVTDEGMLKEDGGGKREEAWLARELEEVGGRL